MIVIRVCSATPIVLSLILRIVFTHYFPQICVNVITLARVIEVLSLNGERASAVLVFDDVVGHWIVPLFLSDYIIAHTSEFVNRF